MKNNEFLFPQDIYLRYLTIINGVHFTHREMDVIACLLHTRGTSKIASLLNIAPTTVITHIKKIQEKLKCNSREKIVDFVETSHQLSIIKKYYLNLVIYETFEKCLRDSAKLISNPLSPLILYCKNIPYKEVFLHYLKSHLKLAGIEAEIQQKLDYDHSEKVLNSKNICIFIACTNEEIENLKKLKETSYVDVGPQRNYYFSVFEILRNLCPQVHFDKIIYEFNKIYKAMEKSRIIFSPLEVGQGPTLEMNSLAPSKQGSKKSKFKEIIIAPIKLIKKGLHLSTWLLNGFLGIGIGILILPKFQEHRLHFSFQQTIRSDLVIPKESVLLYRSDLMKRIDDEFKSPTKFKAVALVGPGGSGKTILARQYAYQQKAKVLWEINAETHESLKDGFEKLAYKLSETAEDKKLLRELQEIKNSLERESKMLHFVREHLKALSNWVLIFDNMEQFKDIQKYFPCDFKNWGQGKIIITTQNINIQNNKYVNSTILIGELNQRQKLVLFFKIMNNGKNKALSISEEKAAVTFLEKIPPYPLDISIAAYYLKSTHIPYSAYLKMLNNYSQGFVKIQESLLEEAGNYTKTRYGIITVSLQKLINENKDFRDLLFFISLVDSQNIPRDILINYKNNIVIDSLMYNLNKYSFIENNYQNSPSDMTFSIHRSTQQIILSFIMSSIDLNETNKLIFLIANTLEEYVNDLIEKESYSRMNLLLTHYDTFMSHKSILSKQNIQSLSRGAGQINFHLNNLNKAKEYLEQSLQNVKKDNHKNSLQITQSIAYLGMTHRELCNTAKGISLLKKSLLIYNKYPECSLKAADAMGYLGLYYKDIDEHQKGINVLEKCLSIYREKLPNAHPKKAKILVSLGMIYREIGEYEKAKNFFIEALTIYDKFPAYQIRKAYALAFLGNVYRDLGKYKESKDLLEKSLAIYKKIFLQNKTKPLWVMVYLGKTEMALGHYNTAKKFFKESLKLYKEFPGLAMEEAWVSENLGNLYREIGKYNKAKNLIEKANAIYKSHSYKNYIFTSSSLLNLGRTYKDLGNYELSKKLIEEILVSHMKYYGPDHILTSQPLGYLGQLYLLTNELEKAEELLLRSLEILQKNNHPEKYIALENLSELFLKKSFLSKNIQSQQYYIFKNQAQNYLHQAYEIIRMHFPEDSAHVKRIKGKLNELHLNR